MKTQVNTQKLLFTTRVCYNYNKYHTQLTTASSKSITIIDITIIDKYDNCVKN